MSIFSIFFKKIKHTFFETTPSYLFQKNSSHKRGKRIYLDYASITPVDQKVLDIMEKTSREFPANPSSLYKEGVEAFGKLEEARGKVSEILEVHSDEIYFTSGGTEGDNLAIVGVLKGFLASTLYKDQFVSESKKPHIISTNIEHPAIREILSHLSTMGMCDVSYIPVEENGIVNPRDVRTSLRPETILVSVMYVNNEIGTIQPLAEIAKVLRHFKKEIGRSSFSFPYLHTDACQAAQYCSLRVPTLGVDLVTLDGSKIYGPRSSGVLYVRRGIPLQSLFYGGDQESGIRPGTENVSQAVGFVLALSLCQQNHDLYREKELVRVQKMRDNLLAHIQKELEKKKVTVRVNGDIQNRVPNNINICIEGIDSEFAVLKLDALGIAVSSVTSCRSKKEDSSSYVIEALSPSNSKTCSQSSVRITLGKYTTEGEIEKAKQIITKALLRLVEFHDR
jgi:cysteine desulfurase